MIRIWECELEGPEDFRFSPSIGSLLHGALNEVLPPGVAGEWHRQGLRPYQQHLYFDKKRNAAVWRIGAFTKQAAEELERCLAFLQAQGIWLRHKNIRFFLRQAVCVLETSYLELSERFFTADTAENWYVLQLVTPTGYKSGGEYMLYPKLEHFFYSASQRWNAFSSGMSLEDSEALAHIVQHAQVSGYRLNMTRFSLEGVFIPAFQGTVEVRLNGPEALLRVGGLLLAYLEIVGLGMKTALGMGGVRVGVRQGGSREVRSLFAPARTGQELTGNGDEHG